MSDTDLSLPCAESYWVVPGLFLAGEYPAGFDELTTRRKLQSLIRTGITTYIDLTHPNDYVFAYQDLLLDEANGYMKTVKYLHHPIPDRSVPTHPQMAEILDAIKMSIDNREPVYVHCIAGTVVGCYLVDQGVDNRQVINEIKQLRQKTPNHWARSPEADEQVDFILSWTKRV